MSKKSKQKNNHSHSNNKPEGNSNHGKKLAKKDYEEELARLQLELVKMQTWIEEKGLKLVLIFEGGTRQAKVEPSSASPNRSIPGAARWWLWENLRTAKRPNGISNDMSNTFRQQERSSSLTAVGTTVPGSRR